MNYNRLLFIGVISVMFLQSCDDEPVVQSTDYAAELNNLTDNVIVATYQDLSDKAVILLGEAKKFKADPNAINLNNVRQAWRDTRAPWESSEGFLFGPVDTKGIDPAIDDWPVNVVDLDAVLSSGDDLTESYIDGLETGLKGFHTIEYLLWDTDGGKQFTEFTNRELQYLEVSTENLKNKVRLLSDSWNGGYATSLKTAGDSGNSLYRSQKAALEQLAEAIIGICDEVAATKIASPLGDPTPNPVEEESRFSHNSKNDFANNIRSISNVYYGNYNVGAGGLSDIIAEKDANLDQSIKNAITSAIAAIENIPGNFSDAIYNSRAEVTEARDKVQVLQLLLQDKMKPEISNL